MSIDTYLGLRALAGGRAMPRAARRHVHLVAKPFVVVGYHLPGDPGAPIGLICGTRRELPHTVVVGEPREGRLRFQQLAHFAMDLNGYVGNFMSPGPPPRRDRRRHVRQPTPLAPQLVVPNQATAQWLCDILGRRLRYLNAEGEHAVHPAIPNVGAHLSFFAGQRVPGSSLVLPLTDVLARHWMTGQLAALDANLATQLAWIRDPSILEQAEKELPAGPIPDSEWETKELSDAIRAYSQLREEHGNDRASKPMVTAVGDALMPAWHASWDALALLGDLPAGDTVADRWDNDVYQWQRHAERARAGQAYFRRRVKQLQAFRHLTRLERLTANLNRDMALDDPLVMATYVASGEALSGEVVERNTSGIRPTLYLRPSLPCRRPIGTELHWYAAPEQANGGVTRPVITAEVTDIDIDGRVLLTITRGAVRHNLRTRLPEIGQHIVLSQFGRRDVYPDTLPAELPWTHVEPGGDDE